MSKQKRVLYLSVIFGVVLVLFGSLTVIYKNQNANAVSNAVNNPYGKDNLHPETIKQLDDSLYQNQILPNVLKESIKSGEERFVYFYSPICSHCKKTTPILVDLENELKIDIKKYNLLEFEEGWKDYEIKGTPSLIHYKNGKEIGRILGEVPQEAYRNFLTE